MKLKQVKNLIPFLVDYFATGVNFVISSIHFFAAFHFNVKINVLVSVNSEEKIVPLVSHVTTRVATCLSYTQVLQRG